MTEQEYLESLDSINNIKLECGIKIIYPLKLDGGGLDFKNDLIEVIKKTGKDKYNKAFEWCAGFGVLGYELLGLNICEHIVFSDIYEPAIVNCQQTAINNNLTDRFTTYLTGNIADIPDNEKWDLLVSNPPHSDDSYEGYKEHTYREQGFVFDCILENHARLIIDTDFKIHQEFFNNISKHLTMDADIYLIENHYYQYMIDMATNNNLTLVGKYLMKNKTMQNGIILHFKPNT